MFKYRYIHIATHTLVWGLVLFFPYLVSDAESNYSVGPLPGFYFTLSGVVHMGIFYGNTLFLYPKFLNRSYWWLYIVLSVLLIVLSVYTKFFMLEAWFSVSPEARSHVLFPSMVVFTVSIFYCITTERIRAENRQKEIEAMQMAVELKFLRSQISPHFLFNILTNLVSLARKKSDHLEASLLKLSGLMRYMLYDADKKITLQQELEYLESFIALQKLRLERDARIGFNIALPAEQRNYSIEPMLLIPFVENAFKHGTGDVNQPVIDIDLTAKNGALLFQVKNKIGRNTGKDEVSGIGLSNVRSRLALLYPDKHKLVVDANDNFFNINLTLSLI